MGLPDAVLFDFSGTLFHIEPADQALAAALGPEFAHWGGELERRGAINGSNNPRDLPAHLAQAWADRDLSRDAHRAAYSGLAVHAGLTPVQAHALYERGIAAAAWHPYPDTVEVLRRLRADSVPVALISNIGWDPRPVLARHGVQDDICALVLSDERGVLKPDPAIFRLACAELHVDPQDAVMIGDNPVADGGAAEIGCQFVLVPSNPANREPDALLRAAGLDRTPHQPE